MGIITLKQQMKSLEEASGIRVAYCNKYPRFASTFIHLAMGFSQRKFYGAKASESKPLVVIVATDSRSSLAIVIIYCAIRLKSKLCAGGSAYTCHQNHGHERNEI